jgi:hypothetical protein
MGTLGESVENGKLSVKPDRIRKHKGERSAKVPEYRDYLHFTGDIDRAIKAQTGR